MLNDNIKTVFVKKKKDVMKTNSPYSCKITQNTEYQNTNYVSK